MRIICWKFAKNKHINKYQWNIKLYMGSVSKCLFKRSNLLFLFAGNSRYRDRSSHFSLFINYLNALMLFNTWMQYRWGILQIIIYLCENFSLHLLLYIFSGFLWLYRTFSAIWKLFVEEQKVQRKEIVSNDKFIRVLLIQF